MSAARRPNRLPDRIRPGLRVLFVGINPGIRSAAVGHHFAGFSNRFWKLLHDSGLVPGPVGWKDDVRLPEWGFGITNLVPRPTRGIDDLRPREYAAGRRALFAKVRRHRPRVVALVGITIHRALFPARPRGAARPGRSKGPRRVLPGLSKATSLPWTAQRFGPRSGHWYGPEPKTGLEALALRDRPLTRTQRLWMANRGVWEALPGAGPTLAVPATAADVDRYLDAYASFLRAVAG